MMSALTALHVAQLKAEAKALCATLRHETEKLRKPLRPEAVRGAAASFVQHFERAVAEHGGKAAAAAARTAMLQVCATDLDTLHIELLSRCGAFDTSAPDQREELWRAHLAALHAAPPPQPAAATTGAPSTPPRSPSPSATPASPSPSIRDVWPTLTTREEALLHVLSGTLLRPTLHQHQQHHQQHHHQQAETHSLAWSTPESAAQLWLLCGQMVLLMLRLRFKDNVIPRLLHATAQPEEQLMKVFASLDLLSRGEYAAAPAPASTVPPPPLIVELRAVLHGAIAANHKVTAESIGAALVHAVAQNKDSGSAGLNVDCIAELFKSLRAVNDIVSGHFAGTRTSEIALASHLLSDDDVWGLWELAVYTLTSGCIAVHAWASAEGGASGDLRVAEVEREAISVLHDVVVCWLFSSDPLLLAHCECFCLLYALLDAGDVALLWEAAVHVLEPQYYLSSKEGVLSLEDNWRPYTLVRFKPERPLGMHCRDYLMARVFSAMFRASQTDDEKQYKPQESWSHWGRALWHDAARMLFTALDISETWSNGSIAAILQFLAVEHCTKLTHVNVQGTGITAHEIELLPQSAKCVALSDCFLHDDDIEVLVRTCPHLEVVLLRNCDELTDQTIELLLRLDALKSVDLSGAVLTTHKARNKLREKGVHLKFENLTVTLAFKLTSDVRNVSEAFITAIDQKLARFDETHADVALANTPDKLRVLLGPELFERLVSQSNASIGHPTMREHLRARVLKRTLQHCMATFTPLAMLVAEYCGVPGLKLGAGAADQIWHSIFNALPAYPVPKPPKPNEAQTWKQHTLEYVLSMMLTQQTHWSRMPQRFKLFWMLGREHIRSLCVTSCVDSRIISKAIHDLAKNRLVLDEIHVSSEAIATIPECPVAVRRVCVHGDPIADAVFRRLSAMLSAQNIELLIFDGSGGTTRHQYVLDKESLAIATGFISRTRSVLLQGAIKANSEKLPPELFPELFLEVKTFERAIRAFFEKQHVKPEAGVERYDQFFCHCVSWLDVQQLLLLEYTGVLLRLAPNQMDFVWRNAAAAHGFAAASDCAPRDYIIAEYLSQLLRDDPLDVVAAFVLQTCGTLARLSLLQVDPLPLIEAEIRELVVGGGDPATALTVQSLASRITKPAAVRALRIVSVPDLHDDTLLSVLTAFSALERLELEGCPGITQTLLDTIAKERPALSVTVTPGCPQKRHQP